MEVTTETVRVDFAIRDYQPADFSRLWEIDQRCFPPGIAYTQMELSGFVSKRHAITLVAEFRQDPAQAELQAPERIAGFVVAHAIRHKYARILTLDILPETRRLGLGVRLMGVCEERLRAQGCAEAYLEAAVNNEPALRLYRKLGYAVLRTLPGYYSSHALDAYQMGKRF